MISRKPFRVLASSVAFAVSLVWGIEILAAPPAKKQTPKSEPKPSPSESKTVERNVPTWTMATGVLPKKPTGKETVFDFFRETADCKDKKPFMIYFYWPEEDKTDPSKNKKCADFEDKIDKAKDFKKATMTGFGRYKCSIKKVDKKIQSQFTRIAPALVIFDHTGKKVKTLNSFPYTEKELVKSIEELKKNVEKIDPKSKKDKAPEVTKKQEVTKKKDKE
jgi:hypothetical protein